MAKQEYPKISLRAARVNAGLTMEEAAKRIGIDRGTLMRYERGDTEPREGTINRMSEAYRFPQEYLRLPK